MTLARNLLILIVLAVVMSAQAMARDYVGVVLDENKEPLPYATVRIKSRSIAALGDSVGEFLLSVKKPQSHDTLTVSYLGYETKEIPSAALGEDGKITVEMTPALAELKNVTVIPAKKIKRKSKGKKHSSGMMLSFLDEDMAGECFGYEFHAKKDSRLVLERVGFFYREGRNQMTRMKFRINVYDMSEVKSDPSSEFVNILSRPVYFDYALDKNKLSGKFVYELPECIVLPKDAMVEIEFLENLGNEIFWYKSNVIGKRTWTKSLTDGQWERNPFATPFFVECAEIK